MCKTKLQFHIALGDRMLWGVQDFKYD